MPAGEYLRFVRVPENLPVGGEVLQVQVYPRKALTIRPVDKVRVHYQPTYQIKNNCVSRYMCTIVHMEIVFTL